MRRNTLDSLISSSALIVAAVLVVLAAMLLWGHWFVDRQVHNQLSSQKIFFPAKGSAAIKGPQFAALQKYAGQQLTTGQQAEAYADHFIAVHLSEVAGGKTYAQVSAAALADPNNATLKGQVDTLFRGTTLRGLLLNAFAFWKMGQIAGISAIVSFVAAGILLILSALGFAHARQVSAGRREPAAFRQRVEAEKEQAA